MDDPRLVATVYELVAPLRFAPLPPLKVTPEPANGSLLITFADPGRSVRRHILNSTGRAVYELLDGRRTVGEVIGEFERRFSDTPIERLQKDIVMLLRSMERKGIIRQLRP